ncbi:MAG: hypothetical protein FWE88_08800 [Phycisphaerae bacterium]|nr:hypothetical protein [Phycisphaerae bacterium]
MLSDQDREQLQREKQAYRDWWAGDRATPFVLERHKSYRVWDVICPSWLANLRFCMRFVVMYFIGKCPVSWIKVRLFRLMGVRIGRRVYIAPGVFLDAFYPHLIELEDGCLLGIGSRVLTHEVTAGTFRAGKVSIGKGSVVGAWSIIRSGVTLGQAVTTGFGSVVVCDVADGLTVGGVPAKPLRQAGPLQRSEIKEGGP